MNSPFCTDGELSVKNLPATPELDIHIQKFCQNLTFEQILYGVTLTRDPLPSELPEITSEVAEIQITDIVIQI